MIPVHEQLESIRNHLSTIITKNAEAIAGGETQIPVHVANLKSMISILEHCAGKTQPVTIDEQHAWLMPRALQIIMELNEIASTFDNEQYGFPIHHYGTVAEAKLAILHAILGPETPLGAKQAKELKDEL